MRIGFTRGKAETIPCAALI